MTLHEHASLLPFNTFRMNVDARYMVELKDVIEVTQFLKTKKAKIKPRLILGGGSNILFTRDFPGIIIRPVIMGKEVISETEDYVIIKAGAGEDWDHFVQWCVEKGLGGIENLSKIPGTVGACPVQNIGAYGVEVKDVIQSVEAVQMDNGLSAEYTTRECQFGYRSSIFKYALKNQVIITRVTFKLLKKPVPRLGYGELIRELAGNKSPDIQMIRDAVIRIRQNKLPDPERIANAGSFFKNPVIPEGHAMEMLARNPGMPVYPAEEGFKKLSAAWLIDQCGWKGKQVGESGIYEKHSLIIVNLGNAKGEEILQLSDNIKDSVSKKFGVDIEPEVNIV